MKCPVCGCENPDDYKFCHDCGAPLILSESIDDLTKELENRDDFPILDSKKLIIIGYIIAILFGWGSFILSFFLGAYGFIGFIGLFFPGFMLNSKDPNIRKHAYIQLAIMIVGIIFTILFLFRLF
ncbi:zinc ribbon domain-containing protein [Methanobrevibacter sp.]|uniref:zinc ribbon domain-containing protein n=1 Tax=Methanobrevibacter sp. TaxID=66852 RepID=UPI0025EA04EA|nr:zinc ribbon domain-containing protein [Methanobrevibacter sp.]MBQ2961575.1 zinc ribbon domain-containing protein [Methanobrevibacter sp.]